MGKKTITIFTPTFNRAHLLPRLYESLCLQTSQDFIWLIIDDGSSDGTDELVKQWQSENKIAIAYRYKKNGGMHTGHNLAYQVIDTELNVCIDSDDYMPEDAVENIINFWNKLENKLELSGFVGLDATSDGKIIGSKMPKNLLRGSYNDLYNEVTGDKKFVLVTDEIQKYPRYPEYENEKLVPLGSLYIMMGMQKDFAFSNEVYCIVEYQEDGSSNSIIKQYFQSPRGFAYAKKVRLKYTSSSKEILKNTLHLASFYFITKNFVIVTKDNKYKALTILMLPLGYILYQYLKKRK